MMKGFEERKSAWGVEECVEGCVLGSEMCWGSLRPLVETYHDAWCIYLHAFRFTTLIMAICYRVVSLALL